ncbi:S-layer homology domain-containing protein [Brevibacillus nitrificans]|uniref:S-layer homology domain-containing protein n=1 Tax=Brevibacillus nitrificans TaxID=651560 RepID=A0A3M8CUU0_9BACL|nr:S-layer homology domain-containing protein [Brevibacillus nitrificans]RNB79388.1 S-layer homology domain-containing protein [Brevibacillus nitrificans]
MKILWKGLGTSLMMVGITIGQTLWGGTWGVYPAAAAQPLQTMSDFAAHPAKESILLGLQKGYIWKYPDGRFYPDKQIVQSQLVASLVAIRGLKETAPVPELPVGHWAKGTYERAQKAGILADVKIDPNKLLTKEEAAQLVFNAWKPYRGVKMKGYTHTGALITWGWMDPAPAGQPKFREDLPVSRGDAAKILQFLYDDKLQIELGEKLWREFHDSLNVKNGILSGKIPSADKNYYINVQFFMKNNQIVGFENGQNFTVNLSNIKTAGFIVMDRRDSTKSISYSYPNLPNLNWEKTTQKFS